MKRLGSSRYALAAGVAAALLAGCGRSQLPIVALRATSDSADSLPHHKTFLYTGDQQSFKVPAGVTQIEVVARGAAGGSPSESARRGGLGGRVYALIPVKPRETLYIFVGGAGGDKYGFGYGGFNGGGKPGSCCAGSFGGGGASDVRQGGAAFRDRILVAGGGGGQGAFDNAGGPGGAGGRSTGESGGGGLDGKGSGGGASGGGQTAGGQGGKGGIKPGYRHSYDRGHHGRAGGLGTGAHGGAGGSYTGFEDGGGAGGGGGGGYYGGGGGGGGSGGHGVNGLPGGGGGGGSSYVEPDAAKAREWQGWKNATSDGLVVLSWR